MYELQKLIKGLLTGTSYTHLYFVFISIQFYILFPLLLWLFKSFRNNKVLIALILPAGLAIQWAFVFLNKYQLHLPNKGSYAPTYMAYYFMGPRSPSASTGSRPGCRPTGATCPKNSGY
ncbi:hypothetical protein HMSSN036_19970 [Paenibacillus macerans]|nr:hypothetical protein HMSSN036_19970 [Paenibacillus macerans]